VTSDAIINSVLQPIADVLLLIAAGVVVVIVGIAKDPIRVAIAVCAWNAVHCVHH